MPHLMSRIDKALLVTIVLSALLSSAGCVKIETGQTIEEAEASSEDRAGRIRSDWADRIQGSSPRQMAELLKIHIDSTTARYVDYGFRIGREWETGNRGRGEVIPADEMTTIVEGWNRAQKPIMTADEDNMEYAWAELKATRHFDPTSLDLFKQLVDKYYEVYSVVFYPAGTVGDYEESLYRVRLATERVSIELGRILEGY